MYIKKLTGSITKVRDLSPTAKEITVAPSEALPFIAGAFVNVFMDINGVKVRRAYSISSSDTIENSFTLSIRKSLHGTMTPLFWERDQTRTTLELMGPLGLNTADKMRSKKIYLFAFGVGAGVVKSLLDHVIKNKNVTKILVATGSRSEDEILHKDYFDAIASADPRVDVRHIVSQPVTLGIFRQGYIQDHIEGIDFNNCDVYACGQTVACDALTAKIKEQSPQNCYFFIEAFH